MPILRDMPMAFILTRVAIPPAITITDTTMNLAEMHTGEEVVIHRETNAMMGMAEVRAMDMGTLITPVGSFNDLIKLKEILNFRNPLSFSLSKKIFWKLKPF
jgi:hypothetical protein